MFKKMGAFIGDYSCKVDVKGRVLLPSAFIKHLPEQSQGRFVVKKDIFEKCLVLYPMNEWEYQTSLIRKVCFQTATGSLHPLEAFYIYKVKDV